MKIAILTVYDDAYAPVANITCPVIERYCIAHGYTPWVRRREKLSSWSETVWQKIPLLRESFEDYDWVMWIDADAMVMNHTIRLERIIESALGQSNLIISRDENGLNAGVFLLKNCLMSHKFLEDVDSKKQEFLSHRYPEQEAMESCLPYCSTAYVPSWVLNQFWCTWMPGDFIVHHAGGSVQDKVKGLTPFLDKVIYA